MFKHLGFLLRFWWAQLALALWTGQPFVDTREP